MVLGVTHGRVAISSSDPVELLLYMPLGIFLSWGLRSLKQQNLVVRNVNKDSMNRLIVSGLLPNSSLLVADAVFWLWRKIT